MFIRRFDLNIGILIISSLIFSTTKKRNINKTLSFFMKDVLLPATSKITVLSLVDQTNLMRFAVKFVD